MKNILMYDINENLLLKLDKKKYKIVFVNDIEELPNKCNEIDLILFNSQQKKIDEKKLFKNIKLKHKNIKIVYMIDAGRARIATKLLKGDIDDYLIKNESDLEEKINECVLKIFDDSIASNEDETDLAVDLLLSDQRIKKRMDLFKKVLVSNINILIEGGKGAEHEMYARAIHSLSDKKNEKFLVVSCEEINRNSFDELFLDKNKSIFNDCKRGTIFFNDIDCLNLDLQSALFKVLKEREMILTKQKQEEQIRFIASSTKNLRDETKKGSFKEELYFKLNGYLLQIAALNERRDYLPVLIKDFYKFYAKKENKQIDGITNKALKMLENYDWSGDIQELKNVIYKAVIFNNTGILNEKDFTSFVKNEKFVDKLEKNDFFLNLLDEENNLKDIDIIELEVIEKYLEYFNGNISEVSKSLNIGRATLYRKLEGVNNKK